MIVTTLLSPKTTIPKLCVQSKSTDPQNFQIRVIRVRGFIVTFSRGELQLQTEWSFPGKGGGGEDGGEGQGAEAGVEHLRSARGEVPRRTLVLVHVRHWKPATYATHYVLCISQIVCAGVWVVEVSMYLVLDFVLS